MSLTQKLIGQSKYSTGIVGRTMLRIMNGAHRTMAVWGLSYISLRPDDFVLDVGCGGGTTIREIKKLAPKTTVIGIDISDTSVVASSITNKRYIKKGSVKIQNASVAAIPYPDEYFHIVTAVQTHFYWPDLDHAIAEIYRIVKQGYKFLLIAEKYKIEYHMQAYKTIAAMRQLLLDCGFSDVEVHETQKEVLFISTK